MNREKDHVNKVRRKLQSETEVEGNADFVSRGKVSQESNKTSLKPSKLCGGNAAR